MKPARRQRFPRPALSRELSRLRGRLADAEEMLRAIRMGEVDALVVAGENGPQVFTLQSAEQAYRVLIESMSEGALTLTAGKTILYANTCFAKMVKCPVEQVMGGSLDRFLSADSRAALRSLLKRPGKSGSKARLTLIAADGSEVPAQLSLRLLAKNGSKATTVAMVVTDMTSARRSEEMLRAFSHRLVHAQEVERGYVALELHDHITQLLCAILVRSQLLADKLSLGDGPSQREALALHQMLGQTASEVERISRDLRPSALEHLGLAAVLRDTGVEFSGRTGVEVKLACVQLTARLPADAELTLYRILQEALKNVEKHARARHVSVRLTQQGTSIQLAVNDDGIGFNPEHRSAKRRGKSGLGLLGMQERAACVGGALNVKSALGKGTTVRVKVPLIEVGSLGGGGEDNLIDFVRTKTEPV